MIRFCEVARTTDSLLVTMLTSFLLLGGLVCVILVIELFLVQKQTRKLIEPINRIDLEHPLEHVCYKIKAIAFSSGSAEQTDSETAGRS